MLAVSDDEEPKYTPQSVIAQKIGREWFALCSGPCGTYRKVSRDHLTRMKNGERLNLCKNCGRRADKALRKELKADPKRRRPSSQHVEVTCPGCGEKRWLKRGTVKSYKSKGLEPLCPTCAAAKQSLTTVSATAYDWVVQAGTGWRCMEYFDALKGNPVCEEEQYSKCLANAAYRDLRGGFNCTIRKGGRIYAEADGKDVDWLREAYEHSIETGGWNPEPTLYGDGLLVMR